MLTLLSLSAPGFLATCYDYLPIEKREKIQQHDQWNDMSIELSNQLLLGCMIDLSHSIEVTGCRQLYNGLEVRHHRSCGFTSNFALMADAT